MIWFMGGTHSCFIRLGRKSLLNNQFDGCIFFSQYSWLSSCEVFFNCATACNLRGIDKIQNMHCYFYKSFIFTHELCNLSLSEAKSDLTNS